MKGEKKIPELSFQKQCCLLLIKHKKPRGYQAANLISSLSSAEERRKYSP